MIFIGLRVTFYFGCCCVWIQFCMCIWWFSIAIIRTFASYQFTLRYATFAFTMLYFVASRFYLRWLRLCYQFAIRFALRYNDPTSLHLNRIWISCDSFARLHVCNIDSRLCVMILIRPCFSLLYFFDSFMMDVWCKYFVCSCILLSCWMPYIFQFDFFMALDYALC